MLSFFTDPYPGELLYSVFARYHFYSGNIDFKDTLTELFGKNTIIPNFEIGNYLHFLCDKLGEPYTPEFLIQHHSIFPFYAPFLPADRKTEILQDLIWAGGQGVYTKMGIIAGSICRKTAIWYCATCAKEDIQHFGEPYIHREHQLQGVMFCPHHGHALRKYAVNMKERSRIEYIRLEETLLDLSDYGLCQEQHFDKLWQIAKAAYYLLVHNFSNIGKKDVLYHYKNLLYEKDLATNNLRIRQAELHELVVSHYGHKFLEFLESSIDKNDEYNWLRVVTRNLARTVHPLRHILLILFLTGDMDNFFQEICKPYTPFGEGPWPCLNRAAKHYQQNIIKQVIVTADSKTRRPVGTFTCECGYSYSRMGPDQSVKDRYRKGRVKEFGSIWEDNLRDLLAEGKMSYRKIALIIGCDVKTVQKYESIIKQKTSGAQADTVGTLVVQPDRYATMCETYKSRIMQLIKEKPFLSRTEIRKLCKKEYAFFYKHDKNWLFNLLPKVKTSVGSMGYIDWNQRDQEILLQLKNAHIELLQQEKTIRISKSALGKKIGQLALLDKHLDKLPCCKKFIDEISESTQDFQIRRCQQVILNMLSDGLPLIEWKIWRKAGLRFEDYYLIKDKLYWNLHNNSKGM